ncbi:MULTISPECIES: hypothetical protein [Natrialbaceae]|uniref:hypothetical protein n=1 Tax=Natrialbaceae TaxID=1644061 RepID=UPI00207D1206|nr:hypothetical protein [Natronococcus sp. CG52]
MVADWRAAAGFARTIGGVNGDRIGVRGFSLGGDEALVTAAREDVDASVGRTPILGGVRTLFYAVLTFSLTLVADQITNCSTGTEHDWKAICRP